MQGAYNGTNEYTQLPTVEDMHKVVLRQLDVTDMQTPEENKTATDYMHFLFEWYVRTYLPCFALKEFFGEKHHAMGTVSSLCMDGNDEKKRITASTEAFALVAYENCRQRWENLYDWSVQDGNQGKPLPRYYANKQETHPFKAKYSDSAMGKSEFGGWSKNGLRRYFTLAAEIQKNRNQNADHLQAMEQVIVDKITKELEDAEGVSEKPKKKARIDPNEDSEEEEIDGEFVEEV